MSALSKIKAIQAQLSSNEKRLADYVLHSANTLRDLSSKELADIVGVSQSSVVKFAQKLAFKGYPAFKLAVIEDLNYSVPDTALHGKIKLNDGYEQMAEKLLVSKIAVLNDTKKLNDVVSFERAVEAIRGAGKILISGIGGSALVGKDFSYKLQKLGMMAFAEADSHAQLAIATTLSKHDLVFAISESGLTREVVNVVKQAKQCQATIISVTKFGSTPVSNHADIALYSVAEDVGTRISSILARTSQELVIDMLFIALMQSSDSRRHMLEKARDVVSEYKRG